MGGDVAGNGKPPAIMPGVCCRLATLFRVSILLTPTIVSRHGRLPPSGSVQKSQLCVTGRTQALPIRTAQIGGYRALHDRGDVTIGNETPGWALANALQRCDDVIRNFPV